MTDPEKALARDPASDRPHCRCGALTGNPGQRLCRKCRARFRYRWRRRHAAVATRRRSRASTGPARRRAQR